MPTDERRSGEPFDLLFVCMGNICRSPMAELFTSVELARLLGDRARAFRVHSAGTSGLSDWPINEPAAAVLAAAGIPSAEFRARLLVADMVEAADLVLTATRRQRGEVTKLMPRAAGRTFTIREFARLLSTAGPVPAGPPADRARDVVHATSLRRGSSRVPPEEDDIADPYGADQAVFDACGEQIFTALRPVIAALAGVSEEVVSHE